MAGGSRRRSATATDPATRPRSRSAGRASAGSASASTTPASPSPHRRPADRPGQPVCPPPRRTVRVAIGGSSPGRASRHHHHRECPDRCFPGSICQYRRIRGDAVTCVRGMRHVGRAFQPDPARKSGVGRAFRPDPIRSDRTSGWKARPTRYRPDRTELESGGRRPPEREGSHCRRGRREAARPSRHRSSAFRRRACILRRFRRLTAMERWT